MIDTHCHLMRQDYDNVDDVIKNMGSNIMIVSTASPQDLEEIIQLCEKYPNVYGTIGIHPEFADTYTQDDLIKIEKFLTHPKIVGVGEVGLDYHYTKDNKERQIELFKRQIELANKYQKTLVVHSREAILDTYELIKAYKETELNCVLHCYSGSLEMAQRFIPLNTYFGIGGVLTFKNEKKLKEIVMLLDLRHFVLETDSPYLAPEPLRGHQNEPCNIQYVALKIAELKRIKLEKVLDITSQTACRLFDIHY